MKVILQALMLSAICNVVIAIMLPTSVRGEDNPKSPPVIQIVAPREVEFSQDAAFLAKVNSTGGGSVLFELKAYDGTLACANP